MRAPEILRNDDILQRRSGRKANVQTWAWLASASSRRTCLFATQTPGPVSKAHFLSGLMDRSRQSQTEYFNSPTSSHCATPMKTGVQLLPKQKGKRIMQACTHACMHARMHACMHVLCRHVSGATRQTCLLCHTTDVSAVPHSKHVCCVTQQRCLLCRTADMSAVSHSRHVLRCHAADISSVSRSRHVCCVAQETCLLCHTADMHACMHACTHA